MDRATIKQLGKVDYLECWQAMKDFTESRTENTPDELWIVEHEPVFTLGLAGKEEHILFKDHTIPIVRTDRGGQVTYHGPGQIVIYLMVDLKRIQLSIRDFVTTIENAIIDYLNAEFNIKAYGDRAAPGVYVNHKKIASLGLKIRKGCSYHGLSFNFSMNKLHFSYINPCGYSGLEVVNLSELTNLKYPDDFIKHGQLIAETINKHIYKDKD